MKRRLNILCVIVVLVLSYSVFETGYYFIVGVKAGVEAGIDGNASEASQKKLMNMKYISLLPEHLSGLGDKSKSASAFLVMAIIGNAMLPQATAYIMHINPEIYQAAYIIPLICFIVFGLYGWRGYKIK